MPSWASEMTSLTPRRPRRLQLAQELGPEGLGLRGADVHAEHLAPAVGVDPDGDDHRDRDDAMVAAHLHVGRVEPDIGPVAFERPVEEGLDPVVDLRAQPADLAPGDAGPAHRLDEVVDRAGRDALDVGLLDHRGQRLLGHPPRLEKARKVRALAQLGDAQLDRAGPRLPVPVAIAVALGEPVGGALAKAGAGLGADLHLHQPLGGEGDHVAQNVGVGGLLHERAKVHHLVGHWGFLGCVEISNPNPTGEPPMTAASRSLATALWRARFASGLLPPSYTTWRDTTILDYLGALKRDVASLIEH